MVADDDRPYWERHYGITRGPVNKQAWRRLGLAWLFAVLVIVLWVVIASLV